MSSNHLWRFCIKNLDIMMRVGCDPKEREPQRILVNAWVEGVYTLKPATLEECINYDILYQLVAKEWPQLSHTILLETRIVELLEHIFYTDERITFARVLLAKPDIFPEMESIGIEMEWTREDYNRFKGK